MFSVKFFSSIDMGEAPIGYDAGEEVGAHSLLPFSRFERLVSSSMGAAGMGTPPGSPTGSGCPLIHVTTVRSCRLLMEGRVPWWLWDEG